MSFRSLLLLFVACFVVSISGCIQPTNVGESNLPIIPGARMVDKETSGARMGDSINSLNDYSITTWRFEIHSESMDEILAFYKANLPDADCIPTEANEYDHIPLDERDEDELIWHSFRQSIGGKRSDSTLDLAIGEGFFTITESIKD